jgi:hypothetical protein
MTPTRLASLAIAALACALGFTTDSVADDRKAPPAGKMSLTFQGAQYVHRWSKGAQHEFTQPADSDLKKWQDMVTLNVHEGATDGEALAVVANNILANYQRHGKILRTESKPRTGDQPAEHLVVAVLGNPELLEVAFARLVLREGVAMVLVYSHRVYGSPAGPKMSEWLKANGSNAETAVVSWSGWPAVKALERLPQSK